MFVFKAGVVGAGTMGGQIAQTIAAAGIPVVLKDIDEKLVQAGLDEARNVTQGQVGKLVEKGKITAEQAEAQIAEILGRIDGTTSYERFGDVDLVIEAVPERMEIKQSVFAELDAATPGHAILASNTSSLSITEIGEATLRPEKVVGFHYFYPASLMPLIEIVEGEETSAETVAAAITFAQAIRKQPITCVEVPGFVRHLRDLARAGGERPVDQGDRRGRRRRRRNACRPLLPRQPARPRHRPARRRAPRRLLRRGTLLRAQGHAEARRQRQARRQDRRRRLL
jgi:3-hydroxyacyl-CoA dehydrogenase